MISEERNSAPTGAPADSTAGGGLSRSAGPGAETSADLPHGRGQASNPEAWVGKSLGKYKITQVVGQGGMGVVFRARDPIIERDVAIKVLAEHLAADSTALARFLAEAQAAGKLNHANVMAIYEICQEGSTNYLVLEYVPGGSLDDYLTQRHCLPVLEATLAISDACRGVGAAHAVGLIHRDIKPANFMRATDGSIKVADFGLAKAAGDTGHHLTRTGMVVGTPYFMSPEQCEARRTDHRSDIYSLGATYYELLTGKSPYEDSDSVTQVMYGHCHGPIPDPRSVNPALPEACSRIVARAMAKAPADRYQSTAEMLADLQAVIATLSGHAPIMLPSQSGTTAVGRAVGRPRLTRGRRLAVYGAALGLVTLIGFGVAYWRPWSGTAVAPAGEPVKVGVLHSLSGTMAASEAPVVDAVLFAINEVNESGGVLGRPVEAVVADGRSNDAVFAREAERLITEEKVPAVFGCWTSSSRKTVKPIFEQHDHLLIYPLQYEGLETSPCIIYMGAAPNQQILPALEWALTTLDKKRCFLVGSDYVFPRAANAIIKDHLQRARARVVGEEYVPLGSQHFEEVVQALKKAQPDLILNTINGDSNIGFFRALRQADISSARTPTLSFSIGEQGIRTLDAADLDGDYAAWTYFESIPGPENERFVANFRAAYPRHRVSDPMETAYLGVKLWARAVNEAQSLEPKKIRRALLNQSMKGPGGEVRIDADTQHCSRTPRIAQIQPDGRFKIVWTAPEPVRPEPYPNSRTAEAWRAFLNDLYTGWGNRWAAPEPDRSKQNGEVLRRCHDLEATTHAAKPSAILPVADPVRAWQPSGNKLGDKPRQGGAMTIDQVINVLAAITLFEMMIAIGLSVTFAQVAAIAWDGRLLTRAALANYVGVPAAALGLLLLFQAQTYAAAGFLIVAVCPGAPYGPPFTSLARGNVVVAVGLMVILAGSSALLAPLLLQVLLPLIAGDQTLQVSAGRIAGTLLFAQLLPLGVGLGIRQWRPLLADRLAKPANLVSTLLNLTLLALILVVQFDMLIGIRPRAFVGMGLLVLATLSIGWLLGRPSAVDRKTLAITTAVRNAGVCLVIASGSFPGTPVVTAVTAYAFFQTVVVALIALGWGRLTIEAETIPLSVTDPVAKQAAS